MKKILLNNYKAFFEDFPIPEPEENDVVVKTQYSFISTGTEAANFIKPKLEERIKSSTKDKNLQDYLDLAKKGIKNPKKSLKFIFDNTKEYLDFKFNKKNKLEKNLNEEILENENILESEPYNFGFALGYSCAGQVIKVGRKVNEFQVGDLVACGGAGQASHAEYVAVKKNLCAKVPEGCSPEFAATATLGSICMQAVRRSEIQIGENVGIIGIGLLGLITHEIMKNTGANIYGFDPDQKRVDKLKENFAGVLTSDISELSNIINSQTDGRGLDTVIVAAANKNKPILNEIFKLCRRKAKVVVLGDILFNFDRQDFYLKELDLLISTSYGPGRYDKSYEQNGLDYPYEYVRWTLNRNLQSYLKLAADKKINYTNIIEKKIKFEEIQSFYNEHQFLNNKGVLVEYNHKRKTDNFRVNKNFKNKINATNNYIHCGLGAYSQSMLIPLFENNNYFISGLVASNHLLAKDFLNQKKIEKIYSNLGEAISNTKCDFVSIANKHNLHSEQLLKCIDQNIPAFLEKPVGINWQDLVNLESKISSVDELPYIHINFNRRYSKIANELKDAIVRNGEPLKIDYNVSVKPLDKNSWQLDPEIGGGRNLGEAVHMYDFCSFLTNDSEVISSEVISFDNQLDYQSYNKENFSVIIKYSDGSVANLNYYSCKSSQIPKELIEVSFGNQTLTLNNFLTLNMSNDDGVKEIFKNETIDKGHKESIEFFLENLNSKKNKNFAQAIKTTKLALYINDKINNDNSL